MLILDVDQDEADYVLTTLDPLAMMAEADPIALQALLEVADLQDELAAFLADLVGETPLPEGKTDPDFVPKPPVKPKTRLGDIWQMGEHRLICGDATDQASIAAVMGEDRADLVWTDPPYNVAYVGATADHMIIEGDRQGAEEFGTFIQTAFRLAYEVTRAGGPVYVCHPDGGPEAATFRAAISAAGWELKQCLIWVKNTFVLSRQDYHWQHEPILYGWKPGAAHPWFGGYLPTTVIDEDVEPAKMSKPELVAVLEQIRALSTAIRENRPTRNLEHPTIKPARLVREALENSSTQGAIVLDPFVGSGTVVVVAEETGRVARAVELDPIYCDVTVKRWEAFTGRKAKR